MSATSAFVVDQRVSSSLSLPAVLQTMAGNGEVVDVRANVVRVDAGGVARTGAVLSKGSSPGQWCIVLNEGGEVIDCAAAATSNIAGASGTVGWQNGQAYLYVWDNSNDLWAPAGAALS